LADLQRTVYSHKWSPISRRSRSGQRKFACQRLTFYHCATQPTGGNVYLSHPLMSFLVRCPYLPWQHWCFFHFARILNGFRRNSRKSLSVTDELITILGEIVSGTKEQLQVHDVTENSNRRQTGAAITQRMTSQISQYIYGTLRPQN